MQNHINLVLSNLEYSKQLIRQEFKMRIEQFNQDGFNQALKLIKSLNNSKRLMILCLLCDTKLTVSELAQNIGLSLSPTSQHLAILRKNCYIKAEKKRQKVYYSLNSQEVQEMISLLKHLFCNK